jgi:hypothetical protein
VLSWLNSGMARMGAQLVLVWQFSQGIVRGPCGLRLGRRWATAGMTRASAEKRSASERETRIPREILPPNDLGCFGSIPSKWDNRNTRGLGASLLLS